MTDRRRAFGQSARSGQSGRDGQDDNPFAPPPEGSPDQPWRPRHAPDGRGPDGAEGGTGGSGDAGGSGGSGGSGEGDDRARGTWGSQWSSRQPGRQGGGFGSGQDQGSAGGDGGRPGGGRGGIRWDPRDPAQRRARYALLSGMWGFLFAVFNITPLALLLGALAVYWAIDALRGAPGADRPEGDKRTTAAELTGASGPAAPGAGRGPTTSASIAGLVAGSLAVLVVAATFTFQLIYKEYYTCVADAPTTATRDSCDRHLPEQLRPILGEQD
ncbi:hypothetical protein V1J52_07140 [Streptomyces sp. TRM 70351]|uniref:hypothetical protein n=1 Tax=Streptomyces sp. TRM 70351 TaxID=3116552 RepID=UPI002E7B3154|nr:hypothetical protein [Streptomyces sp. TRM 70351]MEE1927971.1 hypothetical protein [Streptomyces sp. TRM 70351]